MFLVRVRPLKPPAEYQLILPTMSVSNARLVDAFSGFLQAQRAACGPLSLIVYTYLLTLDEEVRFSLVFGHCQRF